MTNPPGTWNFGFAAVALLLATYSPTGFAQDAPAAPADDLRQLIQSAPAAKVTPAVARSLPPATQATTLPTTKPYVRDPARVAADTKRLFDYLMVEYRAILAKTKDRMGRSIAVVCMARVPRGDATAELLTLLKTDKDPLVQMMVWQSLLARANGLSEAEYRRWVEGTKPMIASNCFRGDTRAALLRVLALAPPDAAAREVFAKFFAETNSVDPHDYPTIYAMGNTVRAWRDPAVVEMLIAKLADINDAPRAEMILHGAGCDTSWAMSRRQLGSDAMWKQARDEIAAWWNREKGSYTVRGKTEEAEWYKLPAQYVPRVDMLQVVNPDDKQWHRDLELRPPVMKTFSVSLCVDATGSMGRVLAWLHDDVKRMLQAIGLVSLEPQIGLTFYRDFGDAFVSKTLPLTGKFQTLTDALAAMDAKGGGDIPEAVREGLQDSLANSKWPANANAPKAIVLIGDAPPHPETQAECEKIVKDAAAKGFRLYAVKVVTGLEADDLSAFDKLAAAGNGASYWTDMRPGSALTAGAGGGGKGFGMARRGMKRFGSASAIAPADASPGEWIVTKLLTDAINPQFADRVRPPVQTLWQMLKEPTVERHNPFPPPIPHTGGKPAPRPPRDPQKQ